jgi:hypothetical protein
MDFPKLITDPYDRKARLYPALLLFLPAIVTVVMYLQTVLPLFQQLLPIIVSCGVIFLLTHLVRDKGKQKEAKLFEKWDGMPSVVIFRHCDSRIDAITKARYHNRLSTMCQTVSPTIENEQTDKKGTDIIYTAWSNYLRGQTRDKSKFNLLFQENINYGFRRNIFGVRRLGIIVSFLCVLANIGWGYTTYKSGVSLIINQFISIGTSGILLMCWVFVFSTEWVRVPANAYAERLTEAIDVLFEKHFDEV